MLTFHILLLDARSLSAQQKAAYIAKFESQTEDRVLLIDVKHAVRHSIGILKAQMLIHVLVTRSEHPLSESNILCEPSMPPGNRGTSYKASTQNRPNQRGPCRNAGAKGIH